MARLIIDSGAEAGMVFPIREPSVTIGRTSTCTVQVLDRRVSRRHATVFREGGVYYIEDLGSKNGLLLNGEMVSNRRVPLNNGDRIVVGDTTLIFEREPEGPADPADAAATDARASSTGSGSVKLAEDHPAVMQEEIKADSGSLDAVTPIMREGLRDPFERLKILYRVSDAVRMILDTRELLERIMDFIWEALSPTRGVILLRGLETTDLEPVVIRSQETHPDDIVISTGVVDRCLRDRVTVLVTDAPTDRRFADNDSVVVVLIRSAICAPLIHKDEVLGVIYIDAQGGMGVRYTNDEMELLSGIANQAAIAIQNARLYREAIQRQRLEKELEIARSIQMNLLPTTYPALPGLSLSAMSLPARQVGGDYYDFLPLSDGRLALVAADVSGKGVPAAMLTASVRASVHMEMQRPQGGPLAEVVSAVNRWACRTASAGIFVTLFIGVFDPERRLIEYVNAGHCFPLLFHPDGTYAALESGGPVLAVEETARYESGVADVAEGDTLIIYTDGVVDTLAPTQELFGFERFVDVIRRNLAQDAQGLRDAVHEATEAFRAGHEPFDDFTLIVARF
jgi:serine phosphatase RsbU (regulator of sigma subunit)